MLMVQWVHVHCRSQTIIKEGGGDSLLHNTTRYRSADLPDNLESGCDLPDGNLVQVLCSNNNPTAIPKLTDGVKRNLMLSLLWNFIKHAVTVHSTLFLL